LTNLFLKKFSIEFQNHKYKIVKILIQIEEI